MRWHAALLGLFVGTTTASCAFLLDFDELQSGEAAATGGTGGSDATAEIPLDQLASAYAQALCKRVDRCFGVLASAALGDESCVEYFEKSIGQSVFAGLAQLKPERFLYHPDKAQACIAAVEGADCDVLFPQPEACDVAIEGLVPGGGDCTHAAECQRGFYCDAVPASCPGKCQAKPKENQACIGGVCAEGLQCEELAGATPGQVKPTCLRPVATELAACEGGKFAGCRIDMTCLGKKADTPGKCHSIANLFVVTETFDCNWEVGSLCGAGFHCALTSGASLDGTCKKPAASGGACTLALPDMCPAGEYCKILVGVSGQCEKLPVENEPCALYALKALCKKGNRCVGRDEANPQITPGTCSGINGLTDACTANELCYSGWCDNNVCSTPNFCTL